MCRPRWGSGRAARRDARALGVPRTPAWASRVGSSCRARGTGTWAGEAAHFQTVTQHACQVGPRPDCFQDPRFTLGGGGQATWGVTVALPQTHPPHKNPPPKSQVSFWDSRRRAGGKRWCSGDFFIYSSCKMWDNNNSNNKKRKQKTGRQRTVCGSCRFT